MVGSWPSHVQTGIANAVRACAAHYPVSVVLAPTEIAELPADSPDRVFYYHLYEGTPCHVEYTHSLVIYYTETCAAMYGITPDGDAHLWSD